MTEMIKRIEGDFASLSDKKIAEHSQRYFKTGPGEYGEGDIFIGLRMPQVRKLSKKYNNISLEEIQYFLSSPVHEKRMFAIILCVNKYRTSSTTEQKNIYMFYMKNKKNVNSWDLVDVSAPRIAGAYLYEKDRSVLYKMASSKNLWDRRIAVLSTFYFIQKNDFEDALKIAQILIDDGEDLIHKALGWMLREIGKRNLRAEEDFLERHLEVMPATMLRYAIERFPESRRKKFKKIK